MQIAGKIVPLGKGDYDNAATYNHLDWVRFDGCTWSCKKDNVKGVEPVEGEFWTLISSKGSKGDTGASLEVTHEKEGKVTTVTFSNAETHEELDSIEVTDGQDGLGSGDMSMSVFATTEPAKGIVDKAIKLSDGVEEITIEDVKSKITDPLIGMITSEDLVLCFANGEWGTRIYPQIQPTVIPNDGKLILLQDSKKVFEFSANQQNNVIATLPSMSWDLLLEKPFESVGSEFETDSNNVLKLASAISTKLDEIQKVYDSKLTIIQNGEVKGIFSANASNDVVVELASGGSGGASTWSEITQKPFNTVGSDFDTSSDELKLSKSIPNVTDTYSSTSSDAMSGIAVASAISGKADLSTTLAGYGITNAYTKTEIDSMLGNVEALFASL